MQKDWPAEFCNVPFQRVTNPGSEGAALGVQRSQVQILSSRLLCDAEYIQGYCKAIFRV